MFALASSLMLSTGIVQGAHVGTLNRCRFLNGSMKEPSYLGLVRNCLVLPRVSCWPGLVRVVTKGRRGEEVAVAVVGCKTCSTSCSSLV